jgi:hypothetical protein
MLDGDAAGGGLDEVEQRPRAAVTVIWTEALHEQLGFFVRDGRLDTLKSS